MAKDRDLSRREILGALGALALLGGCEGPPESELNQRPDGGNPDAGHPFSGSGPIPSVTPNDQHYITSCCGTPSVDDGSWHIDVVSGGAALGSITLAQLQALMPRDKEHTLECISASPFYLAISNAIWSGLPLKEVFTASGIAVPSGATTMKFTSADGYSTGLPVSDLDLPVWLVWGMNGQPIPPEHGHPARLLVPNQYGMKNPKWIVGIEFLTTDYQGFWEQQGYPNDAPYQPNALILEPKGNAQVPAGQLTVRGAAYAGSDPVVAVEVSVDGGGWQPATLDYHPGADVWALWSFDWSASSGSHTVQARCHTQSGATSSSSTRLSGMNGFGGSMQIVVKVS